MDYFVIAEREIVLGFMLAGVKGKPVSNRQEALEAFNEATGQSSLFSGGLPKVLILSEEVTDMISEEVKEWQLKGKSPLIVEVPPLSGHVSTRPSLTEQIREAVGIQI